MRSMSEATAGHRFWFTIGPAALGLVIHMIVAAMFGIGFVLLTRRVPQPVTAVAAVLGAVYGLVVFIVSAFVALPVAARITNTGGTISHMAAIVGWATFAMEHVMFGIVVGIVVGVVLDAIAPRKRQEDDTHVTAVDARSAMRFR